MLKSHKAKPMISCPACGGYSNSAISIGRTGCMRSDGLLFPKLLKKQHCHMCGMLFQGNHNILGSSVPYKRSNGRSVSDVKRHGFIAQGVATLIRELFEDAVGLKVLEVGAGNFLTAKFIAEEFANCQVTAIEPSPENESVSGVSNLNIVKGSLESTHAGGDYDVIFSNHVLEHLPNVKETILHHHSRLLQGNGIIFFIVPNYYPASEEILFADHLYTFTRKSMRSLLEKSEMKLICNFEADWDPGIMVYVIAKKACKTMIPDSFHTRAVESVREGDDLLYKSRNEFSCKWNGSPRDFINRLDLKREICFFGAGEYAQLLSCYFPELYEVVSSHIVSSVVRLFPKKVYELNEVSLIDKQIILAVHQSASVVVSELLRSCDATNIIKPPTYA